MSLFLALATLALQAAPASAPSIQLEDKDAPPAEIQTAKDGLSAKFDEALTLIQDKKPTEAISVLDQIISSEEAMHSNREEVFFSARSMTEAILYAGVGATQKKRTIVVDGTWANAYFFKAFALVDLGRPDEAKPYFDKAIALAPMNSQFFAERGEWFKSRKDWANAYADFQSASGFAEFAPDKTTQSFEKRRGLRGMAFVRTEQRQLKEAEKLLRECLKIDSSDGTAKHELDYVRSLQ